MSKTGPGRLFEDFRLGFEIRHATPRTVTEGDIALYAARTGTRFALATSAEFAAACGIAPRPVDDLLVFDLVLGQSTRDISAHMVADLGYAEGRFVIPVHAGDTVYAISRVIGLQESAEHGSGTVCLRTTGYNQQGETVIEFVRRVTVRKRDPASATEAAGLPEIAPFVPPGKLCLDSLNFGHYDPVLAGSPHFWEDYAPGERIDHIDGARTGEASLFGLARALSFNGLGNAVKIAAINDARTLAPHTAGDILHAWSRIEGKWELPDRPDIGTLRIRTFAAKNHSCADFPGDRGPHPQLVLEFDYTVLMPRHF